MARIAVAVFSLALLLVFALAAPASAQDASRHPTPLFIDTASEGYPCSNGVCSFPSGNVSTYYAGVITSGGGQGPTPYTWSVVAGSLPVGLSLTPSYGVYSAYVYGTPTTLQTSKFTLQVRDGVGHTARQAFTLTIDPTPPLVITYPTSCCPAGKVGASYLQNFFLAGGVGPYTASIAAGQLPPGLHLSSTPPISLTGTPTTAGTFTFTVQVTDSTGAKASKVGSLTID
jgi:large repetitive protein